VLNHNADKLVETVRMYQSISAMKIQLERYQEAKYMSNMSSTICSLQTLIEELEQEINRLVP